MGVYIVADTIAMSVSGGTAVRSWVKVVCGVRCPTEAYQRFEDGFNSSDEQEIGWKLAGESEVIQVSTADLEEWARYTDQDTVVPFQR